jgi:hypothetical protein
LADIEPIRFHAGRTEWPAERPPERPHVEKPVVCVTFDRRELDRILHLYGRMVALGEWRDYAIDFMRERAVFSIFRRSTEVPIYRIEKDPRLARKQGAYTVVTQTGLILKRGHDLARVIAVLDKPVRAIG